MRALVVDDHAEARRIMGSLAGSLGWQVSLAADGAEALMLAQATVPDIVLLDWVMPGVDGWQTARRLRQQLGPEPLLLMVTSHDRERLTERSAAEQALLDGFLVKPVTAALLNQSVTSALQLRSHGVAPHEAAPQRLAGLRLLVVEDNPGNQQVTQELLALEGAIVTLAGDGHQALTLLAQTHGRPGFDAVLMDVQMPVMDGTTATRLIRRQLGLTLPIIAMTAGALETERQACLDAGMDEHIGKPFDPDTVVAVLRRRCGAAPVPDRDMPVALPPALLDEAGRAGIALAEALARMSGRVELFERTLHALHEQDRKLAQDLAQGGPAATRGLHGYRGLAAMMGAPQLAALAAEGEHAVMHDDRPDAQPDADWQRRFLERRTADLAALDRLAAELSTRPPTPAAISPPGSLADRLDALAELLAGSDLEALEVHEALRALVPPQADAPLHAAMSSLDFGTALTLCRQLRVTLEPQP